jgi:hypothetical protein
MSKKIIKNLKKIREVEQIGRPSVEWCAQNREILLHQINPAGKTSENSFLSYYFQFFSQSLQNYILRPALLAILVFGAYFGYSAVTLAAMASLPGESLYPIKILTEKVQLATTVSEENKVKLKMDFVSRRGEELKQVAKQPGNDQAKAIKVSSAVKNITTEVKKINESMNKIASTKSASNVIETAKRVDDKTLKIEKDIIEAHTSLSSEVKKEVAGDIKEAISETGGVGSKALTLIVDKSNETAVKDTPTAVSDKELTSRVSERIKNSEDAVVVLTGEVQRVASSSSAVISNSATVVSSGNRDQSTSTIKEIVTEVLSKPVEAQTIITEAKGLLDQKEFNSALQKIAQSAVIVAETIEKTAIIDNKLINATIDNTISTTPSSSNSVITTTGTATVTPTVSEIKVNP